MQGYFDGLRSEVKNLGVDVTVVVPGPVVSNVVQNAYTGTLDKVFSVHCIITNKVAILSISLFKFL